MTTKNTQNSAVTFRQSFPIDFKLYSDDGGARNPIIYIEDAGKGENLHLTIKNNTNGILTIEKPVGTNAGTVGLDNYHFQLRFRPGTLSANFLADKTPTTVAEDDWEVACIQSADKMGTDCICFLYQGSSELTIATGEEYPVVIEKMNASATGGTRNTNVEFRFKNIQTGTSLATIDGSRVQNISIVNHTGQKNIPLRADVVGSPVVLNNGSANNLLFRIVNTSEEEVVLAQTDATDGVSTFTLSIDVEPHTEVMNWALVNQDLISDLKVAQGVIGIALACDHPNSIPLLNPLINSIGGNSILKIATGQQTTISATVATGGALAGNTYIPLTTNAGSNIPEGSIITLADSENDWELSPDSAVPTIVDNKLQWTLKNKSISAIEPGDSIEFLLAGIRTTLPTGSTTVSIGYENFPGYWPGVLPVTVQKAPIVYRGNQIGVNTYDPTASLTIFEESGILPLKIEKQSADKVKDTNVNYQQDIHTFHHRLIQLLDGTYLSGVIEVNTAVTQFKLGSDGKISVSDFTLNSSTSEAGVKFDIIHKVVQPQPGAAAGPEEYLLYWNGSGLGAVNLSNTWAHTYDLNLGAGIFPTRFTGHGNYGLLASTTGELLLLDIEDPKNISILTRIDNQVEKWSETYFEFDQSALGFYVIADGNSFKYYSINSDYSINEKSSLVIPKFLPPGNLGNNSQIKIHNGFALVMTNNSPFISVIDVSSPDNLTLVNQVGIQSEAIYPNLEIYGELLFVVDGLYLNIFDISNVRQPRLLNRVQPPINPDLGAVSITSLGTVARVWDYFVMTVAMTDMSGGTYFYPISLFIDSYVNPSTNLSAERIGVGKPIAENATLTLPYPKENDNGLVIGDAVVCEGSALAIATNGSSTTDAISVVTDGQTVFSVSADGSIASGISTPHLAIGQPGTVSPVPLFVAPNASYTGGYLENASSGYNYGASGSSQVTGTKVNSPNTSIYANGSVMGLNFVALSDVRVKEHIALSNPNQSLATLLKLKVSDYQYIDFIGKGAGQKRGLIAQEVKAVFPQAVSAENTDFIPDIYAMATGLDWQKDTQQLSINLDKSHDLKPGDRVRLIVDQRIEEKEVVAVPNAQSFVVTDWPEPVDQLFVFGKEVQDCHSVDYDQVAMLGVSAIQALHKQLEDRNQKSAALEQRVEALETENSRLKLKLEEELIQIRKDLSAFKTAVSKTHEN